MREHLSRRAMLRGAAASLAISTGLRTILAAGDRPAFKIGVCDWSLGQRQKIEAMALARQVGLDGVEVSFDGGASGDLRSPDVRRAYLAASEREKVEICSLAMGVLNRTPFAADPRAEQWVGEAIDVMVNLRVPAILLPFFMQGEIKDNGELQKATVARLKRLAPRAEKAGVTLALETGLNAEEHLRLLDAVGSPAVKIYYDVSNMLRRGYDIYREIPRLGKRIARVHLKEKGCRLGQGSVDFARVRRALDEIDYRDWLVIEDGMVKGQAVDECYRQNVRFVRSVFAAG